MPSVIEKLESEDTVVEAVYDADSNTVTVQHTGGDFTAVELRLIQEGKLVPERYCGECVEYSANITIAAQEDAAVKKRFNFQK